MKAYSNRGGDWNPGQVYNPTYTQRIQRFQETSQPSTKLPHPGTPGTPDTSNVLGITKNIRLEPQQDRIWNNAKEAHGFLIGSIWDLKQSGIVKHILPKGGGVQIAGTL